MIRELINGVLKGGLETNTDGRQERWEEEPSLLGRRQIYRVKRGVKRNCFSKAFVFTVQ